MSSLFNDFMNLFDIKWRIIWYNLSFISYIIIAEFKYNYNDRVENLCLNIFELFLLKKGLE